MQMPIMEVRSTHVCFSRVQYHATHDRELSQQKNEDLSMMLLPRKIKSNSRLQRFDENRRPDLAVGLHVVRFVTAVQQPLGNEHQFSLDLKRETGFQTLSKKSMSLVSHCKSICKSNTLTDSSLVLRAGVSAKRWGCYSPCSEGVPCFVRAQWAARRPWRVGPAEEQAALVCCGDLVCSWTLVQECLFQPRTALSAVTHAPFFCSTRDISTFDRQACLQWCRLWSIVIFLPLETSQNCSGCSSWRTAQLSAIVPLKRCSFPDLLQACNDKRSPVSSNWQKNYTKGKTCITPMCYFCNYLPFSNSRFNFFCDVIIFYYMVQSGQCLVNICISLSVKNCRRD